MPLYLNDEQTMWETWLSRTWFPALLAADNLELFVHLSQTPSTSAALAQALHLNPNGLRSVLALLAALGFVHARDNIYHLTSAARFHVLPNSPYYWGGVFAQTRGFDPVAARIRKVLRDTQRDTARTAISNSWGDEWSSGKLTERTAADVAEFMNGHSVAAAERLARTGMFSGVRKLLDIGGGSGSYSIAIARAHADLTCTVLDLPQTCDTTLKYIAEAGLSNRIDTQGLDMFREEWPQGYDAILLSNVLHDWPPHTCSALIEHSRRALRPGGKVFVHEALLDDDGNGPRTVAALSVLVMLGTPGGQLTHNEIYQLLRGGGFQDIQSSHVPPLYSLVQGRRPDDEPAG